MANGHSEERGIDFKYDLRVYFQLLRPYALLVVMLLVFEFLAQMSLIGERYLFKLLIDTATEFANGSALREPFIRALIGIALAFAGMFSARSILNFAVMHALIKTDVGLIYDLNVRFFGHLLRLSHDFHAAHKSGTLISRLSRGGRAVEHMTDNVVFNLLPILFQFIGAAATLLLFDWTSVLAVALTMIVFILYSFLLQRRMQKLNLAANDAEDAEKGIISDVFTNIDSVKYYGKEREVDARYGEAALRTKKAHWRHSSYFRFWDFGHTLILGFGILGALTSPALRLIAGEISVGTLAFIYTTFMGLVGPLFGFVYGMRGFFSSMADFDSLFQYNKLENAIKDAPNAPPLSITKGAVEFRNITFRYTDAPIFKNFSLVIRPHERVAIVGHSGAGKSTLVKLLYRFYDLNEGEILVDGVNIATVKQESLRGEMANVPQECILFDDTILNNIRFSNPKATKKQARLACAYAQLNPVIAKLPKGEHTVVGERGVKLSGGEKQRVSIARALLADKKVIALDEATSSLDSQTEYAIQKALRTLLKGRTSIIIAHRLSTVMNADRIIVLDKGAITQDGTHNDLIRKKGVYRDLWELQKNGYLAE